MSRRLGNATLGKRLAAIFARSVRMYLVQMMPEGIRQGCKKTLRLFWIQRQLWVKFRDQTFKSLDHG